MVMMYVPPEQKTEILDSTVNHIVFHEEEHLQCVCYDMHVAQ